MQEKYIPLKEAAEKLGVARGTLHYYSVKLNIERKKFPLDKHRYIALADLERIRVYKQEAAERSEPATEHMPIVRPEAA
jgi:hypothetical protein